MTQQFALTLKALLILAMVLLGWLHSPLLGVSQLLARSVFMANGELVILAKAGAAMTVRGHDAQEIEIRRENGPPLTADDWSFTTHDNQGVLSLKKRIVGGAIHLVVPMRLKMALESAGGDLRIDNFSGTVTGRIGCGNVSIDRVTGVVDLTTQYGDLRIEECSAYGQAVSENGQIWCHNVSPELILRAGNGGAIVRVQADDKRQAQEVVTERADLLWGEVCSPLHLLGQQGAVTVAKVSAPLRIESIGGSLYVLDIRQRLTAAIADGNGHLDIGPLAWKKNPFELKISNAALWITDSTQAIGTILLSLPQVLTKRAGIFLGLPFATLKNISDQAALQISVGNGGLVLKAELRSGALVRSGPGT